ncbi:hypothetical protein Q3G72_003266 [Acer saccharum]|nr:hypothetical protein Q3G72_003266 [Acer saccharum]
MRCPGSLFMESTYSDKSSEFADEGTAAHHLASECLEGEHDAKFFLGKHIHVQEKHTEWCDKPGKDVYLVDADMTREVQKYVDYVRAAVGNGKLHIEQRLPIFGGAIPDQFGTSDVVIVFDTELVICDLKYGRGVQVFAENNPQMMLYALGALDEFDPLGDIETVRMVIHQPRLNHVDEWTCSVGDLRAFEQEAIAAGKKALSIKSLHGGQVFLNPGEKQCQFCKAKGDCPALRDKVLATVAGDFEVLTPAHDLYTDADKDIPAAICDMHGSVVLGQCKRCGKGECELVEPCASPPVTENLIALGKGEIAVTITEAEKIIAAAHGVAPKAVDFLDSIQVEGPPYFVVKKPTVRPVLDDAEDRIAALDVEHLAVCMDSVDLVEGWCKAVRAESERRLLAGTPVPGWKLVTGKAGSRSWNDAEAARAKLKGMRLRDDVMYDFTLISPTTAEKLRADGVIKPKQWTALQDLISRSSGKPSVAPASDKRPALDIGKVEDDFAALDDASDLL